MLWLDCFLLNINIPLMRQKYSVKCESSNWWNPQFVLFFSFADSLDRDHSSATKQGAYQVEIEHFRLPRANVAGEFIQSSAGVCVRLGRQPTDYRHRQVFNRTAATAFLWCEYLSLCPFSPLSPLSTRIRIRNISLWGHRHPFFFLMACHHRRVITYIGDNKSLDIPPCMNRSFRILGSP